MVTLFDGSTISDAENLRRINASARAGTLVADNWVRDASLNTVVSDAGPGRREQSMIEQPIYDMMTGLPTGMTEMVPDSGAMRDPVGNMVASAFREPDEAFKGAIKGLVIQPLESVLRAAGMAAAYDPYQVMADPTGRTLEGLASGASQIQLPGSQYSNDAQRGGAILGLAATAVLPETWATLTSRPLAAGRSYFSVDNSMFAADEAAGVLSGGSYIRNPTARSLDDLLTESGRIGGKQTNGQYMYVIDQQGEVTLGTRGRTDLGETLRMPHPTLIGGENPQVLGAGMVDIRAGKIYSIDNASGHFKPDTGSLEAAKEAFGRLPSSAFHRNFQGYLPYQR